MLIERIRLISGHSIILGHTPEQLTDDAMLLARMENAPALFREISQNGLFDSYSPSTANYYPTVTPADFVPKSEDFVLPTVRALSEVIVHKSWNPIDFSKNGVLKKSQSLLNSQSVYLNHDAVVGNELGVVTNTFWENSYKVDGKTIPAGINAKLQIDAKSNPKIARGMMMTPPSIHSTSVTVLFAWEPSHNIAQDEFYKKLGTYDSSGQMYRKIATDINRYSEISFVSHGADPYAQLITPSGVINNPLHADKSSQSEKSGLVFYFDFKDLPTDSYYDTTKNSEVSAKEQEVENPTIPINSNDIENRLITTKNSTGMKRNQMIALAALLAFTFDETFTDEQLGESLFGKLSEKLTEKPIDNSAEISALQAFKTEKLGALKAEVLANYMKVAGDNANDATKSTINNASDEAVLNTLNDQYKIQLEAKFPLVCQDCKSHNVSRASVAAPTPEDSAKPKPEAFDARQFANKKLRESGIKLAGFIAD